MKYNFKTPKKQNNVLAKTDLQGKNTDYWNEKIELHPDDAKIIDSVFYKTYDEKDMFNEIVEKEACNDYVDMEDAIRSLEENIYMENLYSLIYESGEIDYD